MPEPKFKVGDEILHQVGNSLMRGKVVSRKLIYGDLFVSDYWLYVIQGDKNELKIVSEEMLWLYGKDNN